MVPKRLGFGRVVGDSPIPCQSPGTGANIFARFLLLIPTIRNTRGVVEDFFSIARVSIASNLGGKLNDDRWKLCGSDHGDV